MNLKDLFRKDDEIELIFTSSVECERLFNQATECLKQKRNKEAIELFDKLLEKEPDNINAINGKGSGLLEDKYYDEALEQFNQSLAIRENEVAYMNKAIIYANTQKYEEALKYCDKTMEVNPELKDVAMGLKNNIIEVMNKNGDCVNSNYNSKASELISKAEKLMEENGKIWKEDSLYQHLQQDSGEFKKITLWSAWGCYEEAIEEDPTCKTQVTGYINQIKSKLLEEFLFFDISQKDDFNPLQEVDKLKLEITKSIFLDHDYTKALLMTKQVLTTIDSEDIDALNFYGALSFYFDEVDDAIESFEKVRAMGNGTYKFFADYNRAFVLRRKTMITHDAKYMVQAMDIYDEMLKDPQAYDKVKPYQREILDQLQSLMNVPLF